MGSAQEETQPTVELKPSCHSSFLIVPIMHASARKSFSLDRGQIRRGSSVISETGSSTRDTGGRPCLSVEEQEVVLKSWEVLQEAISRQGAVAFLSLFSVDPLIVAVFAKHHSVARTVPTPSPDSLQINAIFSGHVLSVMGCIEKVLARLQEHKNLESVLHGVGDIHRKAGVRRHTHAMLIPYFIEIIKPAFDEWTTDMERSWLKFMKLICHVIGEKMRP